MRRLMTNNQVRADFLHMTNLVSPHAALDPKLNVENSLKISPFLKQIKQKHR